MESIPREIPEMQKNTELLEKAEERKAEKQKK